MTAIALLILVYWTYNFGKIYLQIIRLAEADLLQCPAGEGRVEAEGSTDEKDKLLCCAPPHKGPI